MTLYPDSTPTMNALMDLAEKRIPRHPGWRPNRLELAMGEPLLFTECDVCEDMADIAHLGIVPNEEETGYLYVRVCAGCMEADPDCD
jgi:hypothetical protein